MAQLESREIGQRIAQARAETGGMTQEELSDLLGVTTRSVQGYEAGDVIPYRHFERLGEIFSKDLEWFLRGQEPETEEDERLAEVRAQLEEQVARLTVLNDRLEARLAEQVPPRRTRKPA